jgi:hypothetical protein
MKTRLLVLLAGLALPLSTQSVSAQAEPAKNDSAVRALQDRGAKHMGVDQYTSVHHFASLPDGGRIELQRAVEDTAGVREIRHHLQQIAEAFRRGDFKIPGLVHDTAEVPGTRKMAEHKAHISYEFHELPRGGEVRIISSDHEAIAAIHEFLEFQRHEHHATE